MFGPRRPQVPNLRWNYNRPSHNHQWRHPGGPRAPFRGHHPQINQHVQTFRPGNDNYWCETCDRGFPTDDILSKHKQQHQKCNIDGCQFVAHPKVITKHIQMQHSTGLYKRIANIKNPEEIEKWREERRRKYPTKSNIEKKAAELKEKNDRGEKMGLGRNRICHNEHNPAAQNKDNNSGQGLKRRNNNMQNESQPRLKFMRKNTTDNNHNRKPPHNVKPKVLPTVEENKKLKPFPGILSLLLENDTELECEITEVSNLIEDDDYSGESKSNENKSEDVTKPVVCGALSSLICDYASSDEEDNKEIVHKIVKQESCHNVHVSHVDKPGFTATPVKNCVEKLKQQAELMENSAKTITVSTQNAQKSINEVIKCKVEAQDKTIKSEEIVHTVGDDKYGYGRTKSEGEIKKDFIDSFQNKDDSDSGPEEVKVEIRKKDTVVNSAENYKPKDIKKKIIKGKLTFHRPKPKLPSTLLYKLLFMEMQHERNIVLQCIRYIRKNNYFDKKG